MEAPLFCCPGASVLPGANALVASVPLAAGRGSLARGLAGRDWEPEGCDAEESAGPLPVGLGMRGEACPDFWPEVALALAVDCAFADDDEPVVPC